MANDPKAQPTPDEADIPLKSTEKKEEPPKIQEDRKALSGITDEISSDLASPDEVEIKKYAPSFERELTKERIEEDKEKISALKALAESDDISLLELQGGWEWMGTALKRGVDHDEKYARLAQIYLEKEGDSFRIKKDLDDTQKTKFGIGLGDLFPPSIKKVAITDMHGKRRIGIRQIQKRRGVDRVGYYDENGYIAIFGGYKVTPLEFLDEKSEECRKEFEREKQAYLDKKAAAEEAHESITESSTELSEYLETSTKEAVANLQDLRKAEEKSLKEKGISEEEIEKIKRAQKDLVKTEALLDVFGIRMSASSEIHGGSYFVESNGQVPIMLGWTDEMDRTTGEILEKINSRAESLEEGKEVVVDVLDTNVKVKKIAGKLIYFHKDTEIKNLEKWAIQKTAGQAQMNDTVRFIKAMQTGAEFPPGYNFVGTYELEITDLHELHRLAMDKKELVNILDRAGGKGKRIDPEKIIEAIFENPEGDMYKGLTPEQAIEYAGKHDLERLLGKKGYQDLRSFFKQAGNESIGSVSYNLDALANQYNCTDTGVTGQSCCAFMVSRLLGLRSKGGKGSEGSVRRLIPMLVRGIMEKTKGKTGGIVFGMENFRKGDVIVWTGYGSKKRYSHVGMVRDTVELEGEKFIVLQHDQKHLQIDLVPVNPNIAVGRFNKYLTASGRASLPEGHNKKIMEEIAEYRKSYPELIKFRSNSGWYGDLTKRSSGRIAFAVRASILAS